MGRVNIWWPMYPADFTIDTAHLTNEEVGAYVKLLNSLWRSGGVLSCDHSYLSRLVGVSPQKWHSLRKAIAPLFDENAGKWHCVRLSEHLVKAKSNSEKKRQNALKRWQAEQEESMQKHSKSNANASEESMQMQCPSSSSSSTTDLPDAFGCLRGEIDGKNEKNDEQNCVGGE